MHGSPSQNVDTCSNASCRLYEKRIDLWFQENSLPREIEMCDHGHVFEHHFGKIVYLERSRCVILDITLSIPETTRGDWKRRQAGAENDFNFFNPEKSVAKGNSETSTSKSTGYLSTPDERSFEKRKCQSQTDHESIKSVRNKSLHHHDSTLSQGKTHGEVGREMQELQVGHLPEQGFDRSPELRQPIADVEILHALTTSDHWLKEIAGTLLHAFIAEASPHEHLGIDWKLGDAVIECQPFHDPVLYRQNSINPFRDDLEALNSNAPLGVIEATWEDFPEKRGRCRADQNVVELQTANGSRVRRIEKV